MTTERAPMARLHVTARGVVHGVGFRFFVERNARALGLAGWVRNLTDGAVEVLAEGPRPALQRLLDLCRRGPQGAIVEAVEPQWEQATGEFHDFQILPTASHSLRR